MKKIVLSALAILATATSLHAQAPQLRADNIDEVLQAMTLEEKVQILIGVGHQHFEGSGAMMGHQERLVAGAAGTTCEFPRLGIPATVLSDGPAGVHIDAHRKGTDKTFYATGFPVGTCLASTWNTELVEEVGKAIGQETLEYGCDVILGPGMNLHRNPLCGRNFEYYSEDPFVTGAIGVACVKGIQSQGVGVSAKHFAVNSQENDRTRVDEQLSQRAFRELYLRGFEKVVREAKPWTLMSSYNKINGTYAMGHTQLLDSILRKDWGFDGIVMTDWIGIRADLPTYTEVIAGSDLLMPGYPSQAQAIIDAVNDGTLDIEYVNRNARRMLEYIVKTPRFKGYKYSDRPALEDHAAITRQSSTEGMVLLRNENNTLPLQNVKKVALFGVNSYDFMSGGLGSGCVNVPYVVDMLNGLKNAGIEATENLTKIYTAYVPYAKAKLKIDKHPAMWFLDQGQPKLEEIEITERCIATEEKNADAAIITIGRQAGEGIDRKIEGEFNLSETEMRMIKNVSSAFHQAGKPVIVIINSGSVMETASWRNLTDAILVAWQPGQEGGNSVADVLTGKANPSGKLTMTWPMAAADHPSTKNFPQEMDAYSYSLLLGRGDHDNLPGVDITKHEEDIWVGYRYFDTYQKEVAYPFGFGLSYTTFEMSKPTVKVKGNDITVTTIVKNTGKVAGKEVAEVYVAAPQGKLVKPAKELKAFAKTRMLNPGESETLTMHIALRDLASYDEAESQWLVEAGTYNFLIGNSIANTPLRATAKIKEYTEKTTK